MKTERKKLRRLADTQATVENLARSRVADAVSQLNTCERQLERAKLALSAPFVSLVFSDLHIRHVQRLIEKCGDRRNALIVAQSNLQDEVVRGQKLNERLQKAKASAVREEEDNAILERLDWLALHR